jgi:CRISPR-associated protein Cmr6
MQLVRHVAARRRLARKALRSAGHTVARLRAEPEWRLAVGLGNRANAHEIGLSLHGTYGWPVIPGPSLKGLAAAWALEAEAKAEDMARIFGGPRPGEARRRGPGGAVAH